MDNRFFSYESPAKMQDGRFITNYLNNNFRDQSIRKLNNITSAHEYRHFLQLNGQVIIDREKEYNELTNKGREKGRCVLLSQNELHYNPYGEDVIANDLNTISKEYSEVSHLKVDYKPEYTLVKNITIN